uniref:PspC domain-containing protein n=1 Tax=Dictyoglomus thermophilum TaxID=14 RepID=A0A7C3RQH7_DICTH
MKRLYRSKKNRVFLGVSGGIGEYLGIDPVIIRLIFIFSILILGPFSFLLYLLCAIVIPEAPWYEEGSQEDGELERKDIYAHKNELLGWILLAIGVYFLGKTFNFFTISFNIVLALTLIIIGFLLMFKK